MSQMRQKGANMNSLYVSFFKRTFLFSGFNDKTVSQLLSRVSITERRFLRKETVFTTESPESLVFVLEGECAVERIRSDNEIIPLNTLEKYGSFGILSLFSGDGEYPTRIRAKKDTVLLFIPKNDVIGLMRESSDLSINVAKFLCDRVSFLSDKIATFTEKSTLSKLCSYLATEGAKTDGTLPYNPTGLAAIIGSSRASLYRDMAVLEESETIKIENKKIYILSYEGLERNKK